MPRHYFARALGRAAIVAGLAVGFAVLARAYFSSWMVIGVVVAVVALIICCLAAVNLALPPSLLQFDEYGFRALKRRIRGKRQGGWQQVSGVSTTTTEHGPILIIEQGERGRTVVPLALVDAPASEVEAEIRRRLDTFHGYRRLS